MGADNTIRNTKDGEKRAIIIAVSKYYNDNLGNLDFSENDGREMYNLLLSLGYKISENHMLTGVVTYNAMKNAIKEFYMDKNNRSNDTLLFYFSGHGLPEGTDISLRNYLAPSDIDPDEPFDKGYSFGDLSDMLDRSVSNKKILILDCCYSGAVMLDKRMIKGKEEDAVELGRQAIHDRIRIGEGKCLLSSSLSYQKSYGSREDGHSIFTYYLIQGLKGSVDAVDVYGNVTPDSLGKYVFDMVTAKLPRQKPITKTEISGHIILAHYPNLMKTGDATQPKDPFTVNIELGNSHFAAGNYEQAIRCYDMALGLNATNPVVWHNKGKALYELRSTNEAISCYDKAIELDGNYAAAWMSKANAQIKRNPIWVSLGTIGVALGMQVIVPFPFSILPTVSIVLIMTWYFTKNERKSLRKAREITSKHIQDSKLEGLSIESKSNIKKIIGSTDRLLLATIIVAVITTAIIVPAYINIYFNKLASATFET